MPFARNALDGVQTYFEDLGGGGPTVVLYAGLTQSVQQLRSWPMTRALKDRARLVLADHRGHGRSDKPHEQSSYVPLLKAGDFAAVLDELGLERAHFLGYSWGGRLGYCVGEHVPHRVQSLLLGGFQPYAFRPDGRVVKMITEALDLAQEGGMARYVQHFESVIGARLPEDLRNGMLDNDAVAVHAAWSAAISGGEVSRDLGAWKVPCLIYVGADDVDFFEDAKRAAREIPDARFLPLAGLNHGTGLYAVKPVLPSVMEMLSQAP